MNFDYSEEQKLLADSVVRFLNASYGFEARKKIIHGEGWSPKVWATFAEMGLTGLPVSAEHGGFGGGAVDLMGVMEAFGEALVVEPYLPTVIAARAISRGASEARKAALLPGVVEGKIKLGFGSRDLVLGAPVADAFVIATPEGLVLIERASAKLEAYRTIDNMLAARVDFSAAQPLAGGSAAAEEAADFGAALICAEAVGAMKFACDATLEYLKTRKQFGVPIGTFQALQHRIVEMFISYEQAKSMACLACSRVDSAESAKDRARAVSAAKIRIADAARHVSQESVQLHGGMGMTEELKVSHTFRRLTVLARQFGDADQHLARFASLAE
jgi:alkylation response protein AidB-like acyl-CoA dehydrogenase